MNILPKKSFHVLNKDNVARVRKDERDANEKAKKLEESALKAEQEWRLRSLREGPADNFSSMVLKNESKSQLSNKESSEDKEKEKIKSEMKMGVLTFLGGSEWDPINKSSRKPWYTQKSQKDTEIQNERSKDDAIKSKDDPMTLMKAILTPPSKPQKYGTGVNPSEQRHRDMYKKSALSTEPSRELRRRQRHDSVLMKKTNINKDTRFLMRDKYVLKTRKN